MHVNVSEGNKKHSQTDNVTGIVYTLHCLQYALHCLQHVLHCLQYALHCLQYVLHCLQSSDNFRNQH